MRHKLRMVVSALVVAGAMMALWQLSAEATDCQRACHERKSAAYERCRRIPPAERNSRLACFRRADEALQRCLKSCR